MKKNCLHFFAINHFHLPLPSEKKDSAFLCFFYESSLEDNIVKEKLKDGFKI